MRRLVHANRLIISRILLVIKICIKNIVSHVIAVSEICCNFAPLLAQHLLINLF